jgi:hypothetical protein
VSIALLPLLSLAARSMLIATGFGGSIDGRHPP